VWGACLRLLEYAFTAVSGLLVFAVLATRPVPLLGSLGPSGLMLSLLLALSVSAPIIIRRRSPQLSVLLALAGCGAILLVGGQITRGPFVPLAGVVYLIAATRHRRAALAGLSGALVLLFVQGAILRGHGVDSGNALAVALVIIIAWTIGYAVRQRRAYSAHLRDQIATTAVTGERLRIARELHDVVAHSMTVVAVQAGYGEYVFDSQPDKARAALAAIQAVTRDALSDMQRMLGALRQAETVGGGDPGVPGTAGSPAPSGPGDVTVGGGQPAARVPRPGGGVPGAGEAVGAGAAPVLRPAPGLAGLDRLVATTAGAGIRVDLRRSGQVRDIPAGIDASAFRIVQEALTNVVKHSGADSCLVHLGYRAGDLSIEVSDPGPAGASALAGLRAASSAGHRSGAGHPDGARLNGAGQQVPAGHAGLLGHVNGAAHPHGGTGHGIIGMRERVSLCQGEFSAAPSPDGGFRVWARLPLGGGRP